MRRTMGLMLMAVVAAGTTLAAQTTSPLQKPNKFRSDAIGFGVLATLGTNWTMEMGEVGYVHRPKHGLAALGIAARGGTFIDEGAMLGGTQGVAFGASLSARTRMKTIATLGDEEPGTGIGFDLTFELSGYTAAKSPMPMGTRWVGLSLLPALSVGTGDSPHFAIVLGPTAFFSAGKPIMRGMISLRGEAPLARKERHP